MKIKEGWLVKPDRVWGLRFFNDPHNKFTPHVYIQKASCSYLFFHGITPQAVIRECQNLPRHEAIELWKQLIKEGWERSEPLWMC